STAIRTIFPYTTLFRSMNALVATLRSIAREPRIGRFSIVAFNMQEQKVLYRQEASEQIDFPALGDALNSLKLGTVDLKRLSQKRSEEHTSELQSRVDLV